METGELISLYRKQAGLTIDELVKKSGVPKGTLNKIIGGATKAPTLDNMKSIARALGKTLADFDDEPIKDAPSISNEALQVARDYSDLDMPGKRAVRVTLDDQRRRVKEEANRNDKITLFPVKEYNQSASAGYGDFFDDDSFDVIDLVKRPPAGTTYLVRVDGDSMEPTYRDGDRLFVSAQETLNFGEIGVFSINGDLYIKEYGRAGLVSHNPTYPIRRPSPYDTSKIIGRVLGICTSDYLR